MQYDLENLEEFYLKLDYKGSSSAIRYLIRLYFLYDNLKQIQFYKIESIVSDYNRTTRSRLALFLG